MSADMKRVLDKLGGDEAATALEMGGGGRKAQAERELAAAKQKSAADAHDTGKTNAQKAADQAAKAGKSVVEKVTDPRLKGPSQNIEEILDRVRWGSPRHHPPHFETLVHTFVWTSYDLVRYSVIVMHHACETLVY